MKKLAVIKKTMLTFGLAVTMLVVPVTSGIVIANAASSSIKIDAKHFPDKEFRKYVKKFDTNWNGKLSKAERAKVKEIIVSDCRILNLKGIEYFTNLTKLDCSGALLTSLNVSKNTNLKVLKCASLHGLKSLNLSKNTKLTDLDCGFNQLKSLDVSKNTKLTWLTCTYNQLKSLDVSYNTDLEYLWCSSNQLESLDISKNTNLTNLWCSYNQLQNLDVSNNTELTYLVCTHNQLESLDVSKNINLKWKDIDCDDNVQVIGYHY